MRKRPDIGTRGDRSPFRKAAQRAATVGAVFIAAAIRGGMFARPNFQHPGVLFPFLDLLRPDWHTAHGRGAAGALCDRYRAAIVAAGGGVSVPDCIFHFHHSGWCFLADPERRCRDRNHSHSKPNRSIPPASRQDFEYRHRRGGIDYRAIGVSQTNRYPRTDDAEIFANFIGIAPQVDGPITQLAVQDNDFIKQGELLFQIDPRPYEYALQKAKSDLDTLEGQITDERRTIASQVSAVGRRASQHR